MSTIIHGWALIYLCSSLFSIFGFLRLCGKELCDHITVGRNHAITFLWEGITQSHFCGKEPCDHISQSSSYFYLPHHEGNYTLNPPSWRELLITIYLQDYKPDDKTIKKSKNSLKLMNPLLLASTNINMLRTNNDVGFSWSASANSVLVSWISAICD
jgi:hypothetical protein